MHMRPCGMNCLGGLFIRNKPADKVEAFVTSEAQQEGDEQLGLVVEVEDTVVNDCEGLQGSSPDAPCAEEVSLHAPEGASEDPAGNGDPLDDSLTESPTTQSPREGCGSDNDTGVCKQDNGNNDEETQKLSQETALSHAHEDHECEPERGGHKLEERSAPTNPVLFLKAVIDDVQSWQAQVAAIEPAADHHPGNLEPSESTQQFIQASINRLQSRNEELLRRVSYLSHELERSKEERAKLQEFVENISSHKEKLEEELEMVHQNQHLESSYPITKAGRHVSESSLTSVARGSTHNHGCFEKDVANQPIAIDRKAERQDSWDEDQPQQSLRMQDQGDSALQDLANCISKEDYIMTENKCLKMWIATMQGSISQMETEVISLRQDKATLIDLVGNSTQSHLGTTDDNERPTLLPLPPEYYSNIQASREIEGPKSPTQASTSGGTFHRLGSQNVRTSRNTRHTSSARRGQTSNAKTISTRRAGSTSRTFLAGSDYATKHLHEKNLQGSNSWNLSRSTPSWKP